MFAIGCFAASAAASALSSPWSVKLFIGLQLSALMLAASVLLKQAHFSLADIGVAMNRSSPGRLLIGMAIGFALIAAHLGIVLLIARGGLTLVIQPGIGVAGVFLMTAAYLAMSAAEELAFRGYSLRALSARYGLLVAQILVAVAFALYHHYLADYSWRDAILGTMPASILFAMAAVASRGLAVPIGVHAAWNIGTWLVGDKPESGLWRLQIEPDAQLAVQQFGPISYWLVLLLGFCAFWWWHRRNTRRSREADRS